MVTISRISQEKNLEIIPYIAKKTDKDVSFIVAGLLDSKAVLESIQKSIKKLGVSSRVKILPNVSRLRLKELLLESKVYLHTSVKEHFGVSIVEAMASGCIPIVYNSGGPKEFVPSNQRFDDVEEAADLIKKAIENWSPKQVRTSSKLAECFSEKNFSKQFMDIFNEHFRKSRSD